MEQSTWLFQKSPISERFFKSVLNNVNLTTGVKCHCSFCIVSTFSRNNEYLLSFLIQQTLRNTVFLLFWLFLQELSSYRCPLTGGVFLQEVLLQEVSSYRRCLPTGGVLLQEVLPTGSILLHIHRRCPPTGVVLQMEKSTYRRCPPTGGVFLQGDVFLLEVSTYWRCPSNGGVHVQEVSTHRRGLLLRCLLTEGVCLHKVSAYGRCSLRNLRPNFFNLLGKCLVSD